ncbi:MAG: alkaline phosphatase family protein [Fuerstiella sp.]|nr:alkaline phosphatase family protein [Fuerstiella sp.]MCP4855986.1 alkaline phosphatase family protein [Fuerstiella sp.]
MRIVLLLMLTVIGSISTLTAAPPKLILQITVDQLRGDLPQRFVDRMGDGGFRYLLNQGVVYKDAHHAHANTETIVGHVTLATGAHPAAHGMVGNVWFDRALGRLVYNVEDPRYPLISAAAAVDAKTEIDPTQKTAQASGRSPASIQVSTFSDELAILTAGRAKIFGVSVKDRGAISLAGHAGKAFWFSKAAGDFVSSRFYYREYPEWVNTWNASRPTQRYADQSWKLLNKQESYLYGDRDDESWEVNFPGYGRVFPHPFGAADGKYFTTLLTLSPVGDELTLSFAKALIENESIGTDDVTDYLSVSFSSTDYVGHFFGPSSLETEDNLLRLDRTIAALLKTVDDQVGLDNTLIVLSADHGSPEVPGYLNQLGIEAKTVDPKTWDRQPGIAALKKRFGVGQQLIRTYYHPYLYLNQDVIREHGLDPVEVQTAVASEVAKFDGVAVAVTSSALMTGQVPDTALTRMILNNHHARRSGDIYIVLDPHCFVNDFNGLKVASTHGSPWRYDTFVPLIFAGAGLKPKNVHRRIHTVDVATTLAAWLGAKPPSGAAGQVLSEVLIQQRN